MMGTLIDKVLIGCVNINKNKANKMTRQIQSVCEDRLRRKTHLVKVRNFPGANVEDMRHNLIRLIRKKPSHLIIHTGTNDAKKFTSREILDQLLYLKKIVSEQVTDCKVIISTPTVRSDDGKAGLTVSQLTNQLRQLKTGIVDNTNITSRYIGIKGLHLNFSGTTQLAKNFANIIKKNLNERRMLWYREK